MILMIIMMTNYKIKIKIKIKYENKIFYINTRNYYDKKEASWK